MITGRKLKELAEDVTDRDEVFIDEGGVCLCIRSRSGDYAYEVGGDPRLDSDGD